MKLKKSKLLFAALLFVLSCFFSLSASDNYEDFYQKPFIGIGNLKFLEQAYPDIIFYKSYNSEKQDWIITVIVPETPGTKDPNGTRFEFYWANGKLLPEEEVKNENKYWSLFTYYPATVVDPVNYTEEQVEAIRQLGQEENRHTGKGTPMFFFNAIYDTETRGSTETHIKKINFLNKTTNVHERIAEPLKRVEEKIFKAAETSEEIETFINSIRSYDSYSWRDINGTERRSFHSLGIATDIMPKSQGGKQIFWDWARDKYPNSWMKIPLDKRWMPPKKVIDIFEEEGFIWGGKWAIYDDMHFEYHPEIILYNYQKK